MNIFKKIAKISTMVLYFSYDITNKPMKRYWKSYFSSKKTCFSHVLFYLFFSVPKQKKAV